MATSDKITLEDGFTFLGTITQVFGVDRVHIHKIVLNDPDVDLQVKVIDRDPFESEAALAVRVVGMREELAEVKELLMQLIELQSHDDE